MQRVKIAFALAIIYTATFRNVVVQTKFPSIDRLVTPTTLLELPSHRYSLKALEDPHSHQNGAIRADPCAARHGETRAIKKEMGFVNSPLTPANVISYMATFLTAWSKGFIRKFCTDTPTNPLPSRLLHQLMRNTSRAGLLRALKKERTTHVHDNSLASLQTDADKSHDYDRPKVFRCFQQVHGVS